MWSYKGSCLFKVSKNYVSRVGYDKLNTFPETNPETNPETKPDTYPQKARLNF